MEFNAAITEAEDGFDIPTLIDISSKDLRMCPEKIGSGSLNDVYRGQLIPTPQQTCSCNMDMYAVKKIVRDSSILPALFAVKHIKAATEVLQVRSSDPPSALIISYILDIRYSDANIFMVA